MRTRVIPLLACTSICFAGSRSNAAAALPDVKEVLEQCGANSQAGMRDCLTHVVAGSASSLAQAEEKMAVGLKRWDEDGRFVALAAKRLLVSKKVLVEYRDAQCAFAAALGGGAVPNALELRRLACVYALNRERIAQLTRLADDLPAR
jgi:hypothetical protein